MADQASDFIRQSQAMAQQSWEQWVRFLQQSGSTAGQPFAHAGEAFAATSSLPMGDVLERAQDGIKAYLEWMQRAAGSQVDGSGADWQEQVQRLFGEASPFSRAFGGIDSTAAQGFFQQWQAWLAATGRAGFDTGPQGFRMPAFGLQREQQEQQQVLLAAMLESLEQQRRYQALIAKANAQGLERLQDKLARHSEPGREIESLKALYDLWIDAAEEAYAEIALSDEFQSVYGAMVNAQMHERQLQQKQLEAWCRELGMPTRAEVDSIGRRLQEVRRMFRASDSKAQTDEVAILRAEVAALKRQLSGKGARADTAEPVATAAGQARSARTSAASRQRNTTKKATASKKASSSKVVKAEKGRRSSIPTDASAGAVTSRARAGSDAADGRAVRKASARPGRKKSADPAPPTRRGTAKARKAGGTRGAAASVRPGVPAPRGTRRK